MSLHKQPQLPLPPWQPTKVRKYLLWSKKRFLDSIRAILKRKNNVLDCIIYDATNAIIIIFSSPPTVEDISEIEAVFASRQLVYTQPRAIPRSSNQIWREEIKNKIHSQLIPVVETMSTRPEHRMMLFTALPGIIDLVTSRSTDKLVNKYGLMTDAELAKTSIFKNVKAYIKNYISSLGKKNIVKKMKKKLYAFPSEILGKAFQTILSDQDSYADFDNEVDFTDFTNSRFKIYSELFFAIVEKFQKTLTPEILDGIRSFPSDGEWVFNSDDAGDHLKPFFKRYVKSLDDDFMMSIISMTLHRPFNPFSTSSTSNLFGPSCLSDSSITPINDDELIELLRNMFSEITDYITSHSYWKAFDVLAKKRKLSPEEKADRQKWLETNSISFQNHRYKQEQKQEQAQKQVEELSAQLLPMCLVSTSGR
jgi:hypothetical protein